MAVRLVILSLRQLAKDHSAESLVAQDLDGLILARIHGSKRMQMRLHLLIPLPKAD